MMSKVHERAKRGVYEIQACQATALILWLPEIASRLGRVTMGRRSDGTITFKASLECFG